MALTYSEAGLRTQLDAVQTAVDGDDFEAARKSLLKAYLVLTGLPAEVQANGTVTKMRNDLDKISAQLEATADASISADTRRTYRTRVVHSLRYGRGPRG